MSKLRVLVTGGSGVLGSHMKAHPLMKNWFYPTRKVLDITSPGFCDSMINSYKPDVIIHAAALTKRKVRTDDPYYKEKMFSINFCGTVNMIRAYRKHSPKAFFVYISTDYVFNGERSLYTESCVPNPIGYYGFTKFLGEVVVCENRGNIVRTSFCQDPWPYETAFVDKFTSALYLEDVTFLLYNLVRKRCEWNGIVHLGGVRKSFYTLALQSEKNKIIGIGSIKDVPQNDLERIPPDTSFNTSKLRDILSYSVFNSLREEKWLHGKDSQGGGISERKEDKAQTPKKTT